MKALIVERSLALKATVQIMVMLVAAEGLVNGDAPSVLNDDASLNDDAPSVLNDGML